MLTSIIFDGNAQAKRRFLHKSTARFDMPRLSSQGDRQYQHPNQNSGGTVSALRALRGCDSFLREVWMPRPPMTLWTLKYSFEPLSHAAEKHCYAGYIIGIFHIGVDGDKAAGCSKASLSTTAADRGTGEANASGLG